MSLPTPDDVRLQLVAVIDPDLHLNIVDLGLIYGVDVSAEGDVHVQMTLTSAGCPSGPYLLNMAKMAAENTDGARSASVEIVWDPPWSAERMSEQARMLFDL